MGATVIDQNLAGDIAVFSPCEQYRYALTRGASGPTIAWVMLNPSTADAFKDDPTIRRVRGFSEAAGFGRVVVVNLWALRSPDPKALARHPEPVGPENDAQIGEWTADAGMVVAAWGAGVEPVGSDRVEEVCALIDAPIVCLGLTNGGHPRHPLYVPAAQGFEEFAP